MKKRLFNELYNFAKEITDRMEFTEEKEHANYRVYNFRLRNKEGSGYIHGYKYDPSNSKHKYLMRKKFQEIFSNDPSIMNSADILERIKEVYNPVNKL